MKKLIFIFIILFVSFSYGQKTARPLVWYTGGLAADWLVPPSGGATWQYIDTTEAYRSAYVDMRIYDSISITTLPEDTMCARLILWHSDGRYFNDSATAVVDSIKMAGRHSHTTTWTKIKTVLNSVSTTAGRLSEPWYIRFRLEFYTSGTPGANNHSAHKLRYKKFITWINYYRR